MSGLRDNTHMGVALLVEAERCLIHGGSVAKVIMNLLHNIRDKVEATAHKLQHLSIGQSDRGQRIHFITSFLFAPWACVDNRTIGVGKIWMVGILL